MVHFTFHEAELILITALIISAPFVTGGVADMLPIDTTGSWAATSEPWTVGADAGAPVQERAEAAPDAP